MVVNFLSNLLRIQEYTHIMNKRFLITLLLGAFMFMTAQSFARVTQENKQLNNKAIDSSKVKEKWKKRKRVAEKFIKDLKQKKMPQQGGMPDFVEAEGFQSIKGEGEGAGDKPIIEERGGMPEFDITGYASFYPLYANPTLTYYDGSDQLSYIQPSMKSSAKTKMDREGLGFFAGEAGVNFSAKGKLHNDWQYGANIEVQAVKSDIDIDKMYLTLESPRFGKVFLGNQKGPDSIYNVGGQSLIGGCHGIDGAILSNLDYATGVPTARAFVGNGNKPTKIVYYTPEFHGVQLGVGFTPDTKHHGHDVRDHKSGDSSNGNNPGMFRKGKDDKERPSGRNNFSIGLRYENKVTNDLTLKGAIVFVTESTQKVKTSVYTGEIKEDTKSNMSEIDLNDAKSWQFSLSATYKNVTIAGGFFDSGKSRLPKKSAYKSASKEIITIPAFMCNEDGTAGRAWNIGARIDWKKWAFAGVYHNTSRNITKNDKTRGHVLTLTADYLLKPGFKIFTEFDYMTSKSCAYACNLYNINIDEKNAVMHQKGWLITGGITIQF